MDGGSEGRDGLLELRGRAQSCCLLVPWSLSTRVMLQARWRGGTSCHELLRSVGGDALVVGREGAPFDDEGVDRAYSTGILALRGAGYIL